MCGRFALYHTSREVAESLAVDHVSVAMPPRYNIAPGQPAAVVVQHRHRTLEAFRWGLVPFWAQDARIGNRMINARAETLAAKPAFRAAFKRRRCVIPASGFYEWRKTNKSKQPVYIHSRDGRILALAGLWEEWLSPDDELLHTCTIVTTAANALLAPVHPRMPVILDPTAWAEWLEPIPETPVALARLQQLLRPYAADDLLAYPVSPRVNTPAFDTPECIARLPDSQPLPGAIERS